MPNKTDGYVHGNDGYYKVADNSGPYAIGSDGSVTLINGMVLTSVKPPIDVLGGTAGAMTEAARADHSHPKTRSVVRVTLGADSTAVVTYTRTFDQPPGLNYAVINNTGKAIICECTDIMTGSLYTGCTVKGYRMQNLPTISALLTDVVTKLTGYDASGASAAGATVSITAIQI